MSLVKPKTIEELILQNLASGEKKTTVLLREIDPDIRFTKQGFYQALRKLKKEEVVIVYKGMVSLNTAWIERMDEWISQAQETYLLSEDSSGVLALKEKESVSYVFATTTHLDTFWGHTQSILVNKTPVSEAVYSYDPHYWFYIARKETERRLVDGIVKNGKQFLMTVGGMTPLDKVIQRDFTTDDRQYHMETLFEKRNYYVVVIGDYVTEVLLDEAVAKEIDAIYEKSESITSDAISKLQSILALKVRHKIKISRNSRKARELKARLGKNFFIKK